MASGCFGLRLRRGSVEGMFANARWPLMFLRRFSRACVHFRTYFFRASHGKETPLSSRRLRARTKAASIGKSLAGRVTDAPLATRIVGLRRLDRRRSNPRELSHLKAMPA